MMMMMKSVFSKYARVRVRVRCARNFSTGRPSSSHSPKDTSLGRPPPLSEDTKTILPLWQQIFEMGKKTACGAFGLASGYKLASVVLPDHSEPLIREEQFTRACMERIKKFLIDYADK